jgi:large subunit ribosomal protein L21
MYAIVDIAGQQFKVEQGQEIFVHRLDGDTGTRVDFNSVLLIDDSGAIKIGTPMLEGAFVQATILEHLKGDKVLVFKKKKRKGYKKLNGHRQYLSLIKIEEIFEAGGKPKQEKIKKEAKPKKTKIPAAVVIAESVEAVKEEARPAVKKPKKEPKKAPAKTKTAKTAKPKTEKTVKAAAKTTTKSQAKPKPKGGSKEKPAKA